MTKLIQKKILIHFFISIIVLLSVDFLIVWNSGFFDNLSAIESFNELKNFLLYQLILLAPFLVSLFLGYKFFLKKGKRIEIAVISLFGATTFPGAWHLSTYDPGSAWESFFPILLLELYFIIFFVNVFFIFLGRAKE